MSSLDSSLTWKFLGVGVTYTVLPIYCGYELVDERVRSRAFILHFRLEVLDQLLVSWVELDSGRQPHPIRLAVDFLTAVGAVLGGGDPVFLKLLVDELRGAAAVALIHV